MSKHFCFKDVLVTHWHYDEEEEELQLDFKLSDWAEVEGTLILPKVRPIRDKNWRMKKDIVKTQNGRQITWYFYLEPDMVLEITDYYVDGIYMYSKLNWCRKEV